MDQHAVEGKFVIRNLSTKPHFVCRSVVSVVHDVR